MSSINNTSMTMESSSSPDKRQFKYRVGYWWSEKKSQKLDVKVLTALFAERDCELVKIDLERPLEEQEPFSLIVHKISDIVVKADQGDAFAKKTISAFESYVRKHPLTRILDPLDNNRLLIDRYKQYKLIEQSGLAKEGIVFTPPFVNLTSTNHDANKGRIRRSRVPFPLICKPILAQGSTCAHQMCIVFNEAGLKDIKPPCVAQSFVNHNAKLFKLFVIKDKYHVIERPSLKNFQAGDQETVFFFSHDISKPNSSSSLTELDEKDKLELDNLMSKIQGLSTQPSTDTSEGATIVSDKDESLGKVGDNNATIRRYDEPHQEQSEEQALSCPKKEAALAMTNGISPGTDFEDSKCSPMVPSRERLDDIVRLFNAKLGLTFYGLDLIIENDTGRYAIIDMNTFPGYDGVENFLTIFRDVVCDAIPREEDQPDQVTNQLRIKKKQTEIDSGIEST